MTVQEEVKLFSAGGKKLKLKWNLMIAGKKLQTRVESTFDKILKILGFFHEIKMEFLLLSLKISEEFYEIYRDESMQCEL